MHIVDPYIGASIAKTFQSVFPNTILWADPVSLDAILIGTKDEAVALGTQWPGYARSDTPRNLSEDAVRKGILLDREELARYASYGKVITDDNQLLAYGNAVYAGLPSVIMGLKAKNYKFLNDVKNGQATPASMDAP